MGCRRFEDAVILRLTGELARIPTHPIPTEEDTGFPGKSVRRMRTIRLNCRIVHAMIINNRVRNRCGLTLFNLSDSAKIYL